MNESLLIIILATVWLTIFITEFASRSKQTNQLNQLNQNQTNMKLSELSAKLTAIDANVTAVAASVAALQASLTDVELPADAQAALDKLTADTTALSAEVNPTPAA